jgi:hypothetical protein
LRRLPNCCSYDVETIYKIPDEGFIADAGFTSADGQPLIISKGCSGRGDVLLIHGSAASRMMDGLTEEIEVQLK